MAKTKFGSAAIPLLVDSQLKFRIGLARKRTASHPLDSMDFIMMDLERPEMCSRFADGCTGDLTGRLLEFLSSAEMVDGLSDPRLGELFERILKMRRPSGLFGKYAGWPKNTNILPEEDPGSGASRLLPGFARYYELTLDARALESAVGIAEQIMTVKDSLSKRLKSASGNPIETWITEHFARLYGITGDQRYLNFCGFINDHIITCQDSHSHGFMSAMRGLQLMSMYTGDLSWNEKPEYYRHKIIDEHYELADGCICEVLPRSYRTEGCSIADWLMMNLNAGFITNDATAYEKAETILFNALFFNQFVTGGFGHRSLTKNGYAAAELEEAWWCCTEHCGMAMCEYARHTVTVRNNIIHVNFLTPGKYLVPSDGSDIEVVISSTYPATGDAIINVKNAPSDVKLQVRVPKCIKNPVLNETRDKGNIRAVLKGKVGHTIQEVEEGVVLKYGPLILSPSKYPSWAADCGNIEGSTPEGYISQFLPGGIPELLSGDKDADGFLRFDNTPLLTWNPFEEGPGARCGVGKAAVNVTVRFDNGRETQLRFWPLCYNTSNFYYYKAPIVFKKNKK